MSDPSSARPASPTREAVVAAAIDLFTELGYDATSVEQIAQAAGVSRSTFFRQFGSKEDVVFADHDEVVGRLRTYLGGSDEDAWSAVCSASLIVFEHFAADPALARRRYTVVRQAPTLREREIVAVFRYERLFDDHLRAAGVDPLDAVAFAAVVTAVHNHVLRRLLRGEDVEVSVLRRALDDTRRRFGVLDDDGDRDDDLVVAMFPRRMPAAEVARRLGDALSS
jgi:AcrR family transcriptional regulator